MTDREKLPETRKGTVAKRTICGFKCYINVNFYEDTKEPAELFIDISKYGSIVSGIVDTWATTVSIALQYGVPWSVLKSKFIGRRFDPISDEDSSIVDGIAKTVDELVIKYKET